MCCWIGTENQSVLLYLFLQFIQHDPGLDPDKLLLCIDPEHVIHVFREIDYHRDIAALSRQARAAATARNGGSEFSARRDGFDHVAAIARNHHSDRNLSIVGAVRGVERAIAVVKTDFSTQISSQLTLQCANIDIDLHVHTRGSLYRFQLFSLVAR